MELVYKISSIVAIIAALTAAIAGGVQWWSGNLLSNKQENKIIAMEKEARIRNPTIFSQKLISPNVPDGNFFVQKYAVSINSPVQHRPLYTYFDYDGKNGDLDRVGEMQYNDTGSGIRQVEGVDVSYVDTEYTLKTNRAVLAGEKIIFTLERRPNVVIRQ